MLISNTRCNPDAVCLVASDNCSSEGWVTSDIEEAPNLFTHEPILNWTLQRELDNLATVLHLIWHAPSDGKMQCVNVIIMQGIYFVGTS